MKTIQNISRAVALHKRLSQITRLAGGVSVGAYMAIKLRASFFNLGEPRTADYILMVIWMVSVLWVAGIACWLLIRFMVDEE